MEAKRGDAKDSAEDYMVRVNIWGHTDFRAGLKAAGINKLINSSIKVGTINKSVGFLSDKGVKVYVRYLGGENYEVIKKENEQETPVGESSDIQGIVDLICNAFGIEPVKRIPSGWGYSNWSGD
jgi:hypothetical protein